MHDDAYKYFMAQNLLLLQYGLATIKYNKLCSTELR